MCELNCLWSVSDFRSSVRTVPRWSVAGLAPSLAGRVMSEQRSLGLNCSNDGCVSLAPGGSERDVRQGGQFNANLAACC